jgi:hypothetical protein
MRPGRWLLLGLYVAAILATPLLHHDFACHQKSPTHCQACTANPLASRIERPAPPCVKALPEAGAVGVRAGVSAPSAPRQATQGRSPPA